jgi:hypothetical protein
MALDSSNFLDMISGNLVIIDLVWPLSTSLRELKILPSMQSVWPISLSNLQD